MTRLGMLIDAGSCAGCFSCVYACKLQNATPAGTYWCKVHKSEKGTYPNSELLVLPHSCMHCQDAPCVNNCPTGASAHNEDGLVMVDYDLCIGCEMCIKVCPYGARTLNVSQEPYFEGCEPTPFEQLRAGEHRMNVVDKCIMCYGKTRDGSQPACVETCISRCRWYGDLDDPNSEISQMIVQLGAKPLYEDRGTNPSVYYAGVEDADWEYLINLDGEERMSEASKKDEKEAEGQA